EIIWLNLDPRAGFVLAQIDGEVSFDDLYAICGLKRLDTARILSELLEQGVVQVQGRDQAVAKRAVPRNYGVGKPQSAKASCPHLRRPCTLTLSVRRRPPGKEVGAVASLIRVIRT